MASVDPRLDRLERLVDRVQEQINQLHSSSMQMVTTAFSAMEQRLVEKLDRQTADLGEQLDKLRAQVVPMSEHEHLMARVEELYRNDVGERANWERMNRQVPILWDERTRIRAVLGFVVFLSVTAGSSGGLALWAALHR